MVDSQCQDCTELSSTNKSLVVILIGLGLLFIAVFQPTVRKFIAKFNTRSTRAKGKHLFNFFQCVTLLPVIYSVPFPSSYITFLDLFAFVNLSIVQIFSVGCIKGWGYHANLVSVCLLPVAVLFVLAIAGKLYSAVTKKSWTAKQTFGLFLMFLWCFYPYITNIILQAFNCETFDNGVSLLRLDFAINCDSSTHQWYQSFALAMIFVYPVGTPCLFLSAMWPYRKELSDPVKRELPQAKGRHLSFFCSDYQGSQWYWEIVELGRKALLNGFLLLVSQGSLLQLELAAVISFLYIMAVLHIHPMRQLHNNYLVAFISFMLLLTYKASQLLKILEGNKGSVVSYQLGYDPTWILVLLIGTAIAVLVVGLSMMMSDIKKQLQQRKMKYASDVAAYNSRKGDFVELPKLLLGFYHLFFR